MAILKYFGLLCGVLAVMIAVPLAVSVACGDFGASLRYVVVVVALLLLSIALTRLTAPRRLQANEAMVISALIFLFASLAMTWPTMAAGVPLLDAFFEAVSGVTTTGLTTVSPLAAKPASFLFARAWMQWFGGLGIVVLCLATMVQPGLVAKRLGDLQDYEEDLIGGTRAHARRAFWVYATLTVTGVVVLGLLGAGWLDALLYTLAAVSTGRFSPHGASLAGLQNGAAQAAVVLLSMAGGVSLLLYPRLVRDGWRLLLADRQFQGYLIAAALTALLLSGSLWFQGGLQWPAALRHGVLNALSAQSTAGFSSLPIAGIDPGSKLVLILSMLLGGSVGSTAGGFKIMRLLIVMRVVYLLIERTGMPRNAFADARLGGRRLEADEIRNALSLVLIYIVLVMISWLPFVFLGYRPLDALFEVVSAVATAGLSAGITGPALDPLLKLVLCADMLLGRLEIFAWLVLAVPGTWLGKRMEE